MKPLQINKPTWQQPLHPDEEAMVVVPMIGKSPSWHERTTWFTACSQRAMKLERLLVAKVGSGRLHGQIFMGSELQTIDDVTSVDLEIIGSPTAFGLNLVIEPGVIVRLGVTWVPGPWTIRMTVKEWERRARKGSWGAKIDWPPNKGLQPERYSLRIQGGDARLQLVDAKTYRQIARNRLGQVEGFEPFVHVNLALLARLPHDPTTKPPTAGVRDHSAGSKRDSESVDG